MKGQSSLILCLSLLAVPQTALSQSPAGGQGESEDDLSGTWLVTVHLTTTDGGVFFGHTETHDFKAPVTFVTAAKAHYSLRGHVNCLS